MRPSLARSRAPLLASLLPLGLAFVTAGVARAQDIDQIEHQFGATDIDAATGNGRLTAAFSAQGEVTVLRWPSPSYSQQVAFATSVAANARSLPHFGARDDMGSFAGVYVAPGPGGGAGVFAWARDAGWTATQRYAADDSNQIVTTLHDAALRVTVTCTDAVPADLDVLVRQVTVTPDPGFAPAALRLVYFANFSPSPAVDKAGYYPVDEWTQVDARDYALGMSGALGALVHFSVPGRPAALVAPLGAARSTADVDAFLSSSIAGKNGATDGSYVLLGGDRPPDGFQCGYDLAPAPAGAPEDAYQNASDTSGALGGSPSVLWHADGALGWNLPPAGGTMTVFLALGGSYETAAANLAEARARGGDALLAADRAYWSGWLAPAVLPATTDPDRLRIARRALLSIAVGRDAGSGAIVASVASQPPYHLDWPRDGAFLDYALDVAGYHDWVDQHERFYASVQRQHDGDESIGGDAFAGSFAMNYYADGTVGGPISLEIDEVGFALWTFYEHAKWIDEPARSSYLSGIYPSLALAAEVLATRCVDPATGLQCLEYEDDNFSPTQTLHGAIPARLGLASAVRAAMYLGRFDDARRWKARLDQLDAAIEKQLGDPALGYLGGPSCLVDVGSVGPVAWTLWPAELHPFSDPRMQAAAAQIVASYRPFFDQQNMGGAYYGKGLVALALYDAPMQQGGVGDAAGAATVRRWIDLLVKQVPTPGTGHYGESFLYSGGVGGGGQYTDVVSTPHLWEAALAYLSLMAAYSPDRFARPELATLDVPPAPASGCAVAPAPGAGDARMAAWWLLSLLALAAAGGLRKVRDVAGKARRAR